MKNVNIAAIGPASEKLSLLDGIVTDKGRVAGITLDMGSLVSEFRRAMGWDPETGCPTQTTLSELGLQALVDQFGEDLA